MKCMRVEDMNLWLEQKFFLEQQLQTFGVAAVYGLWSFGASINSQSFIYQKCTQKQAVALLYVCIFWFIVGIINLAL